MNNVKTMKSRKALCRAGQALAVWLQAHDETARTLAIELDVDQSLVYGWSWGRSVPSLRNAIRIQRVTGIPAEAWIDDESIPAHVGAGG